VANFSFCINKFGLILFEETASQAPAAPVHYDLHHLCPTDAVIEMNNIDAWATALTITSQTPILT